MNNIAFSVIIPLYNKESHICRSINSVLAQTYQNFELIIVNDGSTDQSLNAIAKYQNLPNIKIISQENKGAASSRNRGIHASYHDYIAMLDADDCWHPDFLATIEDMIRRFPNCGIFATAYQRILAVGKVKKHDFDNTIKDFNEKEGILKNILYHMAHQTDPLTASSVCVPKKVLESANFFREEIPLQEDLILWINIAVRYPVAFSKNICVDYHCDAENRATLNRILVSDRLPIETEIHNILNACPVSEENKIYLSEICAKLYFTNSVRFLLHGKRLPARNCALRGPTSRLMLKIKKQALFLLTFMPQFLTNTIIRLFLPPHMKEMAKNG